MKCTLDFISRYLAQHLEYSEGLLYIPMESQACAPNAADLFLLSSEKGMKSCALAQPLGAQKPRETSHKHLHRVLCLLFFTSLP